MSEPPTVLSADDRSKVLEGDDADFYTQPRFVHHVDEPFRDRLTALYNENLAAGDHVLDLMSSWVSHLPESFDGEVLGHGMNAAELRANDALDDWFLQNLNADQSLPLADDSFDAVLCAVSIQYLQYPGAVFADLARVLRSGGICVVSFSNRMFLQKAVRAWRSRDMDGRAALVTSYFEATGAFQDSEILRDQPGGDPFYAVIGRRY